MQAKVYDLIFQFHTGMWEAWQRMKELERYKYFETNKEFLREHAMKVRQLRAEVLSYLLYDICSVAEDESYRFEHALRNKEERFEEEDREMIDRVRKIWEKDKSAPVYLSDIFPAKKQTRQTKAKRAAQEKKEAAR